MWLLHGLAALAPPGLQSQIPLSAASTWVGSEAVGSLPDWLAQVPRIHATGEVFRMRDAYGTRFAVIVGLAYPGTADRPVYLFDIDASGFVTLVGAGVFDDVEQAGSAWSTMVGEAANGVRPERVTRSDELLCLVHVDLDQHGIRGDEPRTVTDNWFRANRRIHDLAAALDERGTAGLSMPRATSLYHDVDSSVMTEPFTAWYTHAFDTEPDPEAVETLGGEWMEGMIPETWFAVSPRRVVYQLQLIGDWIDGPLTDAVRELLPAWVRWLAERNGLPEHLAERAISVAELP